MVDNVCTVSVTSRGSCSISRIYFTFCTECCFLIDKQISELNKSIGGLYLNGGILGLLETSI